MSRGTPLVAEAEHRAAIHAVAASMRFKAGAGATAPNGHGAGGPVFLAKGTPSDYLWIPDI